MTVYQKEMSHDFVMLSDSWTDKFVQSTEREAVFYRGCSAKRVEQMLTRMDRNFGDSM